MAAPQNPSLKERFDAITQQHDALENICNHVANGGSLIDLAELWNVRYSDVYSWLSSDNKRKKKYDDAIEARGEWYIQSILREIHNMGTVNLKEAFHEDGTLKPISEIPDKIMKCISGIDVLEEFDYDEGKKTLVGHTKKVKTYDRLRALEMLGKHKHMFIEKKIVLNGNNDDKNFRDEFFGLGAGAETVDETGKATGDL